MKHAVHNPSSDKSLMIGLLLPRNFKFYNHEAVEGMVLYAADRPGLHFADLRFLLPEDAIPRLKTTRLDALVMGLNISEYRSLKPFLPRSIPIVNIHPDRLAPSIHTVRIDLAELASMAVKHLAALGFRHLACLGGQASSYISELVEHMRPQADARGIDCTSFQFPIAPSFYVTGQTAPLPELDQWLQAAPKPIAVTTTGGYSASLLAQSALRLGISIPDDLAILSLSDDETCLFTTPPISAFRSVGAEIGRLALSLIDARLGGKAYPMGCTEVPPPTIIIDRGSTGLAAGMSDNIQRAIRHLRAHACEGITVEDILKQVPSISRSTLFQEIRRFTGRTPAAEIRRLKIDRARHLLAHSNLPLARIAEQCGFSSDTQFSITFRQVTGQSPRSYRQGKERP